MQSLPGGSGRRCPRPRPRRTTGIIFRSLGEQPRRAGLTDVDLQEITVPVGEWGGRIGSLMATDCRALFVRLAATLAAADEEGVGTEGHARPGR
jgi:hypothetical protein